jgi:hypothetical protein
MKLSYLEHYAVDMSLYRYPIQNMENMDMLILFLVANNIIQH